MKAKELLDAIIEKMQLKNDAALSRALQLTTPQISRMRHGKLPIGSYFLIYAHEASGMSIRELKRIAGMPSLASLS